MNALHVWGDTSWTGETCCSVCGLAPSEYELAKRDRPGSEGCTWADRGELLLHLFRRGLLVPYFNAYEDARAKDQGFVDALHGIPNRYSANPYYTAGHAAAKALA